MESEVPLTNGVPNGNHILNGSSESGEEPKQKMEKLKLSISLESRECPICFKKDTTDMRKLECEHSFCIKCLENFTQPKDINDGWSISCPTCARVTKIGNTNQMSDVQKQILVHELAEEITRRLKQVSSAQSRQNCDACARDKLSVVHCKQCRKNLCELCLQEHEKSPDFDSHITRELPPIEACSTHPSEIMKSFCGDCDIPVCGVCIQDSHQYHSVDFIQNIAPAKRKSLKNQLSANEMTKIQLSAKRMHLFSLEEDLESQYLQTNRQVDMWEKALHEIIKSKAAELKENLRVKREHEIQALRASSRSMEGLIACYEGMISFVRETINSATDTQLVVKSRELSNLVDTERLNTAEFMPSDITEPTFDGNPAIEKIELCEVVYKIKPVSRSRNGSAEVDGCGDIPLSPLSPADSSAMIAPRLSKVMEISPEFSVWDTMIDHGVGNLYLRTADEQKPIKVYDLDGKNLGHIGSSTLVGDSSEGCMCIDRRGHILVTTKNSITRYDKSGKSLGEVTSPRFGSLRGVAYSHSCNVYIVSDIEKDCILVIDPSTWNVVRQIGSRGDGKDQFVWPSFVAADNPRSSSLFAVSDGGNECVKVFDVIDGRFIETYRAGQDTDETAPGGGIRGVRFDSNGRVVACDRHNRQVVRLWRDKDSEQTISQTLIHSKQLESEPKTLDVDANRQLMAVSVSVNRWMPDLVNIYSGFES